MKTRKILALFLCFIVLCQIAQGQSSAPATEDPRISRLAGLAKVWGTVKYFHPFLAYRDIDWDKALIETIPKVNAAKTPQDYQTALNQMLAVLNDKSTRAEIQTEIKTGATGQPAAVETKHVRTEKRRAGN